jgi:uncharacterized membrane protein YfcA
VARPRAFFTNQWLPVAASWLLLAGIVTAHGPTFGLLIGIGFFAAFMSGLVGVGGAVLLIPLLLYLPPLFGLDAIAIKTVTGITIVQVTGGALSAGLAHLDDRRVDRPLFLVVGLSMAVCSFLGALLSAIVPGAVLEAIFATMALVASAFMLILRNRTPPEVDTAPVFRRPLAFGLGAGVGFLAGMVGAGGAFILIPVLLYIVRIPLRVTIGTSLWIVVASSIAGLLGKAVTGQVDWPLALALLAGALPAGLLGAVVSRRTHPSRLATILGLTIALVAVRMWVDVLGRI